MLINTLPAHARCGFEPCPGRDVGKYAPKSRSHRALGYPISHAQPDVPAKIDFVELVGGLGYGPDLKPISGRWDSLLLGSKLRRVPVIMPVPSQLRCCRYRSKTVVRRSTEPDGNGRSAYTAP